MKKPRIICSIDWLQVSCTSLQILHLPPDGGFQSKYPDRWGNHLVYTYSERVELIHGYEKQCCIRHKGLAVLHVGWLPREKDVNPLAVNIKISNHLLYTTEWFYILNDFCMNHNIAIKTITRCDLAIDFNYFMAGLCPQTFVRKYLTKNRSYIRVGSNKWAAQGMKELHGSNYDYLRFGSRQSGVSVYLYNKTLELHQQKDKPYIRDVWQSAGLNTDKDVWRLEISLTSQGIGLKDITTNLFRTLFVDDLNQQQNIEAICLLYAQKYFHFKRVVPNIIKKQNLPDLLLLPPPPETFVKPACIYRKKDTGRTEKAHMNYLTKLIEEVMQDDTATKYKDIDALRYVVTMLENIYTTKRAARKEETKLTERLKTPYRPDDFRRQLQAMKQNSFVKANEATIREIVNNMAVEQWEELFPSQK